MKTFKHRKTGEITTDVDTLYFIGKQVKELEQQLKDLENEK